MKVLRFYLQHPTESDRVDIVETKPGCVLVDSQATGKHTPLISVSQVLRVELVADEEGAT